MNLTIRVHVQTKKTYTTPYDAQYAVDIAQSRDYMLQNYHLTST